MKVAVIQLKIRKNIKDAVMKALKLVDDALILKADIIVLPELFAHMWDLKLSKQLSKRTNLDIISKICTLSKSYRSIIVAGSVFEENKKGNPYNTSHIISNGNILNKYRKIHLFDLNEKNNKYNESSYMSPGKKPVVVSHKNEKIGVAICNDLRYPELFRSYALNGAVATVVVSAFTHFTGKSHWHLLNKARAVENQMYIISANMCGRNKDGMKFFGHSLIVDPWGKTLAEAMTNEDQIIFTDIKPETVKLLREKLPTLKKVKKSYKV